MKPTTILALQSAGITLQFINAGLATVHANPAIALIVGGVVGGFQFFLQHVGNNTQPENSASKAAGA